MCAPALTAPSNSSPCVISPSICALLQHDSIALSTHMLSHSTLQQNGSVLQMIVSHMAQSHPGVSFSMKQLLVEGQGALLAMLPAESKVSCAWASLQRDSANINESIIFKYVFIASSKNGCRRFERFYCVEKRFTRPPAYQGKVPLAFIPFELYVQVKVSCSMLFLSRKSPRAEKQLFP